MLVTAVTIGAMYQFFGLTYELDGGGVPRLVFIESSSRQAERIERHRADAACAGVPASSASPVTITPSANATECADRNSHSPSRAWLLLTARTRLLRTGLTSAVRSVTAIYRETPLRLDWPADRSHAHWKQPVGRRIRVVRDRSTSRVHNRAAWLERGGRCLRRRHRSRAVDERVAGGISRVDGRRRPARDADLVRWSRLRAGSAGRTSRPGRGDAGRSSGEPTFSRTAARTT